MRGSAGVRNSNRGFGVANSRFLIRSGVRMPHLASHALVLALRRLQDDWLARCGYALVMVEMFVAPPWRGTCCRAANWTLLGETAGTGRQGRRYAEAGIPRQVFVHLLRPDFRQALMAETVTDLFVVDFSEHPRCC